MTPLPPPVEAALAALVLVAAVFDVRRRRIPNWLTFAGIGAGFALNAVLSGPSGLARSGLGFGLALGVYLPLFAIRALGAGDVKLMAAAGALAGPANWFVLFLLTSVIGGVIALAIVLARGEVAAVFRNIFRILASLLRLRAPYRDHPRLDVASRSAATLPHALPIALGAMGFLLLSRLVQ